MSQVENPTMGAGAVECDGRLGTAEERDQVQESRDKVEVTQRSLKGRAEVCR